MSAAAVQSLKQIFPHIPSTAISEVIRNLEPDYVGNEAMLIEKAMDELLSGNFTHKKKAPRMEEVDTDAIHMLDEPLPPGPPRDLASEKREIMEFIVEMAPKVEKDWLSKHYETFVQNSSHKLRAKGDIQALLANYMLEHSDYPKILPPGKKAAAVMAAATKKVDYTDYSKRIPSFAYSKQCLEQLQNEFRWVSLPAIRGALARFNGHFYPTYKFLKTDLVYTDGNPKPKSSTGLTILSKFRALARASSLLGQAPNPEFLEEYMEATKEDKQNQSLKDKKVADKVNEEEYEGNGQMIECGCCFVDMPFERMVQCAEGHLFCDDCIKRYLEEAVYASGQTNVHCLSDDGCKAAFPIPQLERAVPAHQLEKIFARLADLSIKKAGLENVHQCPHCDYQVEITNPDEKLLVCQNPDCGMETCVLCREPNHIPLRCHEVEKTLETDYRKKIEEAMTETLVRTCPKCKAKFFKTEGCNKMTCSCGTHVCYICRALIPHSVGYGHFCSHDRNPREYGKCDKCSKCYLFLKNTAADDDKLVEQAKQVAESKLQADNPELAKVKVGVQTEPVKKAQKPKKLNKAERRNELLQLRIRIQQQQQYLQEQRQQLLQQHQQQMANLANQAAAIPARVGALAMQLFGIQQPNNVPAAPPPAGRTRQDVKAQQNLQRQASRAAGVRPVIRQDPLALAQPLRPPVLGNAVAAAIAGQSLVVDINSDESSEEQPYYNHRHHYEEDDDEDDYYENYDRWTGGFRDRRWR